MYLEVPFTNHKMEDNLETHMEEIHSEEIRRKSHLSIHLLDLMDGQHLTHTCSYHYGINHLMCNLYQNQQPNCHTRSYNIQFMSKTLIWMFTLECSRRPLKLMVNQWKLTSSTCLVLFSGIVSLNGEKTMFKTI